MWQCRLVSSGHLGWCALLLRLLSSWRCRSRWAKEGLGRFVLFNSDRDGHIIGTTGTSNSSIGRRVARGQRWYNSGVVVVLVLWRGRHGWVSCLFVELVDISSRRGCWTGRAWRSQSHVKVIRSWWTVRLSIDYELHINSDQ